MENSFFLKSQLSRYLHLRKHSRKTLVPFTRGMTDASKSAVWCSRAFYFVLIPDQQTCSQLSITDENIKHEICEADLQWVSSYGTAHWLRFKCGYIINVYRFLAKPFAICYYILWINSLKNVIFVKFKHKFNSRRNKFYHRPGGLFQP